MHAEENIVRVLLLENSRGDCEAVCSLLDDRCSFRFAIEWAYDLSAAVDKLSSNAYDVILCDLALPDGTGVEVVTTLREHGGQSPIIALSTEDKEELELRILEVGAQDYLVKGEITRRALVRAILHAVQRQESLNQVNKLVVDLENSKRLLSEQTMLLRKKNKRLRKLYKTAQEFVDNVSHDFRTPLTVIKDYLTIIREGMVGEVNSEQKKLLDKMSVRADDLNNMVDDLLDVSKLESGLLGAWRRTVDVRSIIDRAESMLEQRAHVKNVELVVECEPYLPEAYCDADKVSRTITNLAVNAIKFAGQQGRVRVAAEADPSGHQIIVSVSDNGPGIEEQAIKEIFERFKQLDAPLKSNTKGFGLGLNIARKLCRLNLGELSVQSKVGTGSTFSFTIPFADPREVFRRWLSQRDKRMSLQLVEIAIDAREGKTGTSGEFDSFLNCQLRSEDLLFRLEESRWLVVLSVAALESDNWFKRLEQEHQRINRNRPMGPLPGYKTRICGRIEATESDELIYQRFDQLAQRTMYLPSTSAATV